MYRIAFPRFLSISLLCLASLVFCAVGAEAQTFTLEAVTAPSITFGQELTVKVKLTPASGVTLPPLGSVKWLGLDGLLRIKGQSPEGTDTYVFVFETLKASDPFEIRPEIAGFTGNKLTITIAPQVSASNLDLTSGNFITATDAASRKLTLKQQTDATVGLKLKDNKAIPSDALQAVSSPSEVATALVTGSNIVVTGRKPGDAKVTISSNGKPIHSFDVQVTEAVKEINASIVIPFTKGDATKPLVQLGIQVVGKNGTVWSGADAVSRVSFFSNRISVVDVSDGANLKIGDAGEAELRISDKEDANTSKIITVKVAPKAEKIILETGGDATIIVGQTKAIHAKVQDEAQRDVPNVTVKFECQGANCAAINIVPRANNSADVKGISDAASVKIVAKATGIPDADFVVKVIGADKITDFRPLLIRMDMLGEQMAKDLFGRKASDEFYIAKLNLFNKLKKTDAEYFGDSILVYSESLQVRVALELKCKPGDSTKSEDPITQCANNDGKWVPVTVDMIQTHFDDDFDLDPPISATEPMGKPEFPENCQIKAPKGFVGLYRPYSYETVAVTHDRRDERSLRSRILTVLNGALSFTSFITAVAIPGPGSDLPLGLEKTNALLLPSFEKLFPSMKEVQRQNVLTMVMRQLEEIPFGGNIERKVFFPKGALEGIWPGHRIRISGVSTFDACAEAAIIKKVGQQ